MNLLQFIILSRETNLIAKYLPQVLIHHSTKVIHNCIRKVYFFLKKKKGAKIRIPPLLLPTKTKKYNSCQGFLIDIYNFVFTYLLPQTMISNYCRDDESGWELWRNAVMCAHASKSLRRPSLRPYLLSFAWGQNIFLPLAFKNIPKKIVLLMPLCDVYYCRTILFSNTFAQ